MSLFNDVFSSFFTTDGKKKTTTPVAPTLTPSPDMRQSTSASESIRYENAGDDDYWSQW